MARKRIKIRYKKERAVLADVLPYETPVTFTNRRFYDFLEKFKVSYKAPPKNGNNDGRVSWESDGNIPNEVIRILFNLPKGGVKRIKKTKKAYCDIPNAKKHLISFNYEVKHKQKQYRTLSVPHPRSQLRVVDFYEQYKETIIYYCSLSPFSIRAPDKVATTKFYNDDLHKRKSSKDTSIIEEHNKEYKHQKSFFSYRGYSNVHKFYESDHYHRCEKKYNKLLRLDISKCFDSIYTHSISWATLGKMVVKDNIGLANKTFAGQFDRLMQNINHSETNGIVIGPELSRIFAEIILQAIDKNIERTLKEKHDLVNKVHYEIFRYVDDYFIFYNEDNDKNTIVKIFPHALKEYKLHLNSEKEVEYEKPLITDISIAKERISKLLEKRLKYKLDEKDAESSKIYKGTINSNKLITEFKAIIKECHVEYKDMLTYSFAIVERKCQKIMDDYHEEHQGHRSDEGLIDAIIAILEFVFFIYSVSPRVNTTIKLCTILQIFLLFLKGSSQDKDTKKQIPNIENIENRHRVFKCIYDNIHLVLKKNKQDESTQVETLYLLIVLSELGREYLLEEEVLAKYFGIKKLSGKRIPIKSNSLNYFSLTVVLFYMKNREKYKNLRDIIEKIIIKKFRSEKNIGGKHAEYTMLLLDMLSCPFIKDDTKRTILGSYGITRDNIKRKILDFHGTGKSKKMWFTTWERFNFGKELDTKRSQEVY